MMFHDTCYLFDMIAVRDIHKTALPKIFKSNAITKIIHACAEDSCTLYHHLEVEPIRRIFDTQVAHRLLTTGGMNSSRNVNDFGISLSSMLQTYLGQTPSAKTAVGTSMSMNPHFWKTRPLTDEMVRYATQDVLYLEKLYSVLEQKCIEFNQLHNRPLDFMQQMVFVESEKISGLCRLNPHIQLGQSLTKGTLLQAMFQNIRKKVLFMGLNIGLRGIVNDQKSKGMILASAQIGEVLTLSIQEVDLENKTIYLVYPFHGQSGMCYYSEQKKAPPKRKWKEMSQDLQTPRQYSSAHLEQEAEKEIDEMYPPLEGTTRVSKSEPLWEAF